MSMSTHVEGVMPADERWKQMKAVHDACTAAGLEVPAQVVAYFGFEVPDDAGAVMLLDHRHGVRRWHREGRRGFDVELALLPEDVAIVRFYHRDDQQHA